MKSSFCQFCRKEIQPLPYICKYCGESFCVDHRLPERHKCKNIAKIQEATRLLRAEELREEMTEFERACQRNASRNLFNRLRGKLKFGK